MDVDETPEQNESSWFGHVYNVIPRLKIVAYVLISEENKLLVQRVVLIKDVISCPIKQRIMDHSITTRRGARSLLASLLRLTHSIKVV